MSFYRISLLFFILLLRFSEASAAPEVIEGEYLVKFKEDTANVSFYNIGQTVHSFRNFPALYHQKFSKKKQNFFFL